MHTPRSESIPPPVPVCDAKCAGRTELFQSQPLQALALGSVQRPSTDNWTDAVAELRGTQVVFYHTDSYNNAHYSSSDLVAVLMLHHYRIDVVRKDVIRVYFTPNCKRCGVTAYVQPFRHEVDGWRRGLARVRATKMVTPADLRIFGRIGVGGYGKVYMAAYKNGAKFSDVTSEYSDSASTGEEPNISNGDTFALKVISKTTILESCTAFRHLAAERLILERARGHPYLLGLSFAFQTREHVFLGLPLCPGGDLAAYMARLPIPKTRFRKLHSRCCAAFFDKPRLEEHAVRRLAAQVVVALQTLHEWHVLYRDLKPENILLDATGNIRLADFGLARFLHPEDEGELTVCGTETCMAPEMRAGHGGFEADVWSLGATLYRLLTGIAPFPRGATNAHQLPLFPCFLSRAARSLLRETLAPSPGARLKLGAVRAHKFFRRVDWAAVEAGRTVALPDLPGLLGAESAFGTKIAMTGTRWRGLNSVHIAEDGCWDGREPPAMDARTVPGFEFGVGVGRFRRMPVFGERRWVRGACGGLPKEARLFLYS